MKWLLIILVVVSATSKAYSQLVEPLPQNCNTIVQTFKLIPDGYSTLNIIPPNHISSCGFRSIATTVPRFQVLSSICIVSVGSANILASNLSANSQYHNKYMLVKGILTKKKSFLKSIDDYNCLSGNINKPEYFITPIQFDLLKL